MAESPETDSADPFGEKAIHDLVGRLTGLAPVAFSFAVRTLIVIAAALASQKQEKKGLLSSTTLFLAAVEWGAGRLSGTPPAPAAYRDLAEAVSGREGYSRLRDTYFDPDYPEALTAIISDRVSKTDLSSSVRALLEQAAKGQSRFSGGIRPVPAVALIADLVSGTQADAEEADVKSA